MVAEILAFLENDIHSRILRVDINIVDVNCDTFNGDNYSQRMNIRELLCIIIAP